jgi:hypothetical protein
MKNSNFEMAARRLKKPELYVAAGFSPRLKIRRLKPAATIIK